MIPARRDGGMDPLRAGGLFHFRVKKDHVAYSIAAKIMISATATAPEMLVTRASSRQNVSYIAAFLPTAPYFTSNDGRISAVCYDQYSSTLAIL